MLVNILMLCESMRMWLSVAAILLYFLIPKAVLGFRPIALLTGLVRLWEALRVVVVKRWAADNARDFNHAAPAHSADHAAFALLVFTEAADPEAPAEGAHAGTVLADLEKAYERVRFDVAFRCATRFGFPRALLSMILVTYLGPRRLLIKQCASRVVHSSIGICAGSRFAPFLLYAVLLQPMDDIGDRFGWAGIQLRLYVDDVCFTLIGSVGDVVRVLFEALEFFIVRLEHLVLGQQGHSFAAWGKDDRPGVFPPPLSRASFGAQGAWSLRRRRRGLPGA